ncbi:ribosome silencing factor [Kocuria koreensis]|jgi:ribosome-associated protein|uniref:Ribosomal silencing factor RsfS n=1 Tax=Rothia koreensis TaxID=592378 RepID=A0A7K1LGD7_9MICC|nr:ribosome silencing factor [Rothia koreensis]MUN54249.1 ribosome silencing factor [Rothia koreensis]
MTATQESVEAIRLAARAAESKQGTQLNAYDVSETMGLIDGFLVVSASNERLVDAIVDEIETQLREQLDLKPLRREGKSGGRWVLLDFADIVVHVQHQEEREFYALDRLWAEAPRIPLDVEGEVDEVDELPDASELAPEPRS